MPRLSLDLPTDGVFYKYSVEDQDMGAVYYPAQLFYKLYERRSKLGEGTFGSTYHFIKRCSREDYAVKIIRATDDSEEFEQIKREFISLKYLRHTNIVTAEELYYDSSRGKIYYVMKYQKGSTLTGLLSDAGEPLRATFVKRILKQLLEGVTFLHRNGIVHRDIKPDNILITEDKSVKIIDFNVARFFN